MTRSGCSACIRLRYSPGGKYMIYYFHESPSHPFLTPSSIPFPKESRQLTQVQKNFIFNNAKLNIVPVKSYRMSKEHCGSYNNVRGTKTDFKNFFRDLKVYIGNKDGFMFKENFERKVKASNGGFYFDYCVNEHRHLTLFSPFTGVDHHKKCVTFGSTLLSKEDTDSFVWLFETFLKCMGNCEPYCLLTDQDPAMSIAIEKVETDFLKKINAVVWDSDLDPTEFLILEIFFMGGLLRVTSRSEGENNFFCHFTNLHVTLVEFARRYDSALDAQRHEQDELVKKSKNLPSLSCNSCYGDGEEFSVVYDNERRNNYDVTFNMSSDDTTCSCRKFESEGILCRHILFIMKGKFLCEIPSKYLLRCWSKDALKQPMSNFEGWSFVEDSSRSDRKNNFSLILLVGSKFGEVDVLALNVFLNKGSGRSSKSLKSAKEKIAVEVNTTAKKGRTCKACGQSGVNHDSRSEDEPSPTKNSGYC
ncbi:protein FAR1-RELATED SEQUENCE 5-like [Spinacia oleracea]|uniref:Protein FAR1-RELATED SEQUENCE 5-like n=1 Tax=Spinacia oleracea TaxID=3562 RepID=A0ABM3RQU0_SPIOL|nr:protein FAR1-RELATED SEQUENCE 5-like [Spinacia oleracea]